MVSHLIATSSLRIGVLTPEKGMEERLAAIVPSLSAIRERFSGTLLFMERWRCRRRDHPGGEKCCDGCARDGFRTRRGSVMAEEAMSARCVGRDVRGVDS